MLEDKFDPHKVIALAETIKISGDLAITWAYCSVHDKVDCNQTRMVAKLNELVDYLKVHFPEIGV